MVIFAGIFIVLTEIHSDSELQIVSFEIVFLLN